MLVRTLRITVGLVLLLAVSASAARAFDLTGEWRGLLRCQERTPAVAKRRYKLEGLMRISHAGDAFGMRVHTSEFVRDYAGMTVFDVRKPEKLGDAAFAACGTTDTPTDTALHEIGRLRVLADTPRGRGKLRGVSTYTIDGDTIGTCDWSFKWTTMVDPVVPTSCP